MRGHLRRSVALCAAVVVTGLMGACGFGEPGPSRDGGLVMTPVAQTRLPLQASVPPLSGDPQPALADPIEAGLTPEELLSLAKKCAGMAEVTNTADACFQDMKTYLDRGWPCADACLRGARAAAPLVTRTGPDGSPAVFRQSYALIQLTDERCRDAPNDVCLQLPAPPALLEAQRNVRTGTGSSGPGPPGPAATEPTSPEGEPTAEPTSPEGEPTAGPTSPEGEPTAEPGVGEEPGSGEERAPTGRRPPPDGGGATRERERPS